jgi:hypothetical protein
MFRQLKVVLAAISVLLVTSGCMKVDLALTVNKNDTVSGTMILAFSKEAIALAGSMGNSSSLSTDSLITEQPGMTVAEYKDADYEGSKITFEEKPFAEFSTGTSADSLKFTRSGNIVSVTGAINMAGQDPTAIDQIKTNPMTSGLFSKSDISVSITMPGKLTSSNGIINGNTVTFEGELGDNIQIDVQAEDSSALDPLALTAGGIALAGAIVAAVYFLNRRKTAVKTESAPSSQENEW